MFNLKNENIIKKFNAALEIVAKYSKLEISRCVTAEKGYRYNYLTIPDNGPSSDTDDHDINYMERLTDIQESEYNYLAPFYQVWMGEVDERYLKKITKSTFLEINRTMKKIKNEV